MIAQEIPLAPGARIVVRDAEWLVRRVDPILTGGKQLLCVGISELVKDKEAIFLTEIEPKIETLDPAQTNLVYDTSRSYQASLLYIESLMRQTAPADSNLYIGHRAAMDLVPYQIDPAIKALEQPRHRILIADAVGLGKTLEAGILVTELIKRGKGKRILVVAVKSMLTQFQKEFWVRFTIPLTRLDSIGIQRVRNRIPTNHNPFYYYDKSIISVDTLKQDAEYRTYLENAYWDIIIIDEAQNVADRGTGSLRNKVAELLAHRSDTLIMLSATPHDGRPRSFASLMNMLDPTAIANPEDYGKDDIKGLFIRRFKKDIQGQVSSAFKERQISTARIPASNVEEKAFEVFTALNFERIDKRRQRGQLFKTTLEKALFSSPFACRETIRHRIEKLEKENKSEYDKDIKQLKNLDRYLSDITFENFSKYQRLLTVIKDTFAWSGKDTTDRLVIFTERIETLKKLQKQLVKDLKLQENQIIIMHGGLSDIDQQNIVDDFGKEESPVRILLASDVASEGINLHYLSHRMIHFDIPWSLMVFQQRNGRIDRYGQEKTPEIVYLVTESCNEKIRGDSRILEVLIKKDEQAAKNINDPSAFSHVYDITEEEGITTDAIEKGMKPDEFNKALETDINPLDILLGKVDMPKGESSKEKIKRPLTLYKDDFEYVKAAIEFIKTKEDIQVSFNNDSRRAEITATDDLKHRFKFLPKEIWPDNGFFILSADTNVIKDEIKRSRKDEKSWPRIQFLWEHHPIVSWINDKVLSAFGRNQAPVLCLLEHLEEKQAVFIISALIPNRKSHPLLHYWLAVSFKNNKFESIMPFESLQEKIGLGVKKSPNIGSGIDTEDLKTLLPAAIKKTKEWMTRKWEDFEDDINKKLNDHLKELDRLKGKQYAQLELDFGIASEKAVRTISRKEQRKRQIDQIFDDFMTWVEDTMTTENNPYIQVVAALVGKE
ncbi:MAG TPA: DEAD/DEAH box helicase [bacterium]|nr:DEAD/DEAH box helicase [bacterium]